MIILSIILKCVLIIGMYILLGSLLLIAFQTNDWVLNIGHLMIDPWTYTGEYIIVLLWHVVLVCMGLQMVFLSFKYYVKTKIRPRKRKKKINIIESL